MARPEPVIIVGGNSSVHGVSEKGDEVFWTTTGDVVSAMALLDVDDDGQNELVVGSEDFAIKIFQVRRDENSTQKPVSCLNSDEKGAQREFK